jgi:hypothetical protein
MRWLRVPDLGGARLRGLAHLRFDLLRQGFLISKRGRGGPRSPV